MKTEFNWRDYDDYSKWLHDVLTTLYEENQQLKKSIKLFTDDLANMTNRALQLEKQKDDVVDVLKIKIARFRNEEDYYLTIEDFEDLLRMLGEIDVED